MEELNGMHGLLGLRKSLGLLKHDQCARVHDDTTDQTFFGNEDTQSPHTPISDLKNRKGKYEKTN